MSFPKLTNGFFRMADAKLENKAAFILAETGKNADVFPNPQPKLEEINAALDAFSKAVLKASTGDHAESIIKNQKKDELALMLHLLGCYILLVSKGNRAVVARSGFSMAKDRTPSEISKPSDVKVMNTDQSGELLVSVKREKGAAAYMVQYTTDATLKEESWQTIPCTSSKCKLSGLKPGTTYYVRIAVVGRKDQVLYSDVLSRIAA